MMPSRDSNTRGEDAPLVSCIMPTANRRRFVPLAVKAFSDQDYPHRELIVVDDGSDPIRDLLPDDDRVRYVRMETRTSIGAKRNRACEMAAGSLIAHWDDDDWSAPQRLRKQVEALQRTNRAVCGLDRLFFCNPETQDAWQYRYPRGGRLWVAGGTLLYRRDLWTDHPFEDISSGEDTRFVWNLSGSQMHVLDATDLYVARVHSGNTSSKHTHTARWHPERISVIRDLMGRDWARFAGLNTAGDGGDGEADPSPRVMVQSPGPAHSGENTSSEPRVTVTIPYYRCKTHVRRAVSSILEQTYPHLRLVVVNDGDSDPPWDVLDDIDDPRLVRFDLPTNRGRYFADAAVLRATPDPFYCIQDADDWSTPDRIATLLARMRDADPLGAISSTQCWRPAAHGNSRAPGRCLTYEALKQRLPATFGFRSDHHGLFRTQTLRALGGYYGGFRIGYDTLMVNLILMLGSIEYVDTPLYHRTIRSNSLTTSAATGMHSRRRSQVHDQLQALYRDAYRRYREAQNGDPSAASLAEDLAAIATRHVTKEEWHGLETASGRLHPRLARNSMGPCSQDRLSSLRATVHHPALTWNREWAPMDVTAHRLVDGLVQRRPRRILEAGSGNTTALLARYAEATGAEVITLEHEAKYLEKTRRLLRRLEVSHAVDLRHAPLRSCPSGNVWYDTPLDGRFDFVFLDGPPKAHGRNAALPMLCPYIGPGTVLWLHDGARKHERACVGQWTDAFGCTARLDEAGKGVWILTDAAPTLESTR